MTVFFTEVEEEKTGGNQKSPEQSRGWRKCQKNGMGEE